MDVWHATFTSQGSSGPPPPLRHIGWPPFVLHSTCITLFCQCVTSQLASLRCARSNFRGICVAKMAILTQHSREPAFARKRGRVLSTAECEEETYGSRSKVLNKNFNLGGTQPTLLYDFTSSLCGVTQGNPAKHKLGVRFAQGWRKCFHVLS